MSNEDDLNRARYAVTKEEATHRYPTSVYWGNGYFGDHMRYIVAPTHYDALLHMRARTGGHCQWNNLQARQESDGAWTFASRIAKDPLSNV